MNEMPRERKVGLTVLVALLCLGGLVVFLGKIRINAPGFPVKVSFSYVDSLKKDAPVLYGGGVKVGTVKEVGIAEGRVQVTLHIHRNAGIPRSSKVSIHTSGILGEKYVQISPGDPASGLWASGDAYVGVDPGSLDRTLQRIEALTDFLAPMLEDPKFKQGFSGVMANLERLTGELSDLVSSSSGDIKVSVRNLRELTTSLKARTDDIKGLVDSARGMVNEKNKKNLEESLQSLQGTLSKLDKAMAQVDAKKGPLGALVYDEETAENLREILRDLKRHPWKLLWKK